MEELAEPGLGGKVKRINSRGISPWPDLLVLALGKVTYSGPPRTALYSWPTTPIFSPDLLGKRIPAKSEMDCLSHQVNRNYCLECKVECMTFLHMVS